MIGAKTRGRLVETAELTTAEIATMLALMQRHYHDVNEPQFRADLAQKRWTILVYDASNDNLCGFSTQTVWYHEFAGEKVIVLFSGDTIIDRQYWGDSTLGSMWGQLAVSLIESHRGLPCYWFLISQGFRTYRYLPLFFREFYPCHDQVTPANMNSLIHELGMRCGGERFEASRQVIRSAGASYRLRAELEMPVHRRGDPHLEWFSRLNPDHVDGDELCCLAPLSRENFTPAAWRWIRQDTLTPVS